MYIQLARRNYEDFRDLVAELLSFDILDIGQQQAAMFFRSEPNWELAEPLRDLGMSDFLFCYFIFQ